MKRTPDAEYYSVQYNSRAMIPEHPQIFERWKEESAHVRRTNAVLLDLAYGDSSAQRLDLFPTYRANAPLLVFIHGGWWRSLDKSDFSFIAPGYVQAGFNVALTNYTLAPDATVEEIVHEQLRALAWLYRRAEQYDFDPGRIVLAGHSAGAHLAAMLMAALWPALGSDLPPDLVKAGVLLSGLYDLEPVRHVDFVKADLRLEPRDVARLSPGTMPQSHPTPFLAAWGDHESDEFKRQTELIASAWKPSLVDMMTVQGANHLTICDSFGDPGHALHRATCALLKA